MAPARLLERNVRPLQPQYEDGNDSVQEEEVESVSGEDEDVSEEAMSGVRMGVRVRVNMTAPELANRSTTSPLDL